jgi:CPA2 family monovalent cation:H+ antiporter-2
LDHDSAPAAVVDPNLLAPDSADVLPRVIIAGFGRVGQTVAGMLDGHNLSYVAIARDPDRVARQRMAGKPVYFGDMTQIELLRRLHLETARVLVVTLDDPGAADALAAGARAERPDLLIPRARCPACGASIPHRRPPCGAGDNRGKPAIIRGGAGGCRCADGTRHRFDP